MSKQANEQGAAHEAQASADEESALDTDVAEAGVAASAALQGDDLAEGIPDEGPVSGEVEGDGAASGQVDRLNEELAAAQDQLVRQVASFRNYRRRTEEERRMLTALLKGDIVKHLLDVVDDFERAFDAADGVEASAETDYEEAYSSLREGVNLVFRKLMDELRRLGVEPIETEGRSFNEEEHDAMMQQPPPDEETPEGAILHEVQRGYRLGDRVLRHSKVIVAG